MKISELVIIPICDFHAPENKVKAKDKCSLCGRDVCENHRYPVGVKREHSFFLHRSDGPLYLKYDFYPVCVDCASQPLVKIVGLLAARRKTPVSKHDAR